jgi:hypothetical protein
MTTNDYNKWQQMNKYKPKGTMGAIVGKILGPLLSHKHNMFSAHS